jgi:hypothetical protein
LLVRSLIAAALLLPSALAAQQFETRAQTGRWYKGNTHTHTLNSDGDSPPDTVIRWYKTNGYNFLVLSDHDTITEPRTFGRWMDSSFILVPGEEVTGRYQGKPVHLTAVGLQRIVKPLTAPTLLGTLQGNGEAIRNAGGVAIINHPNYRWALSREIIAQTNGIMLFELFNGHPHVHNDGGAGSPSTEVLWDSLLTAGKRIYGVASDDAHWWKQWGQQAVNPGRGWIYVQADRLDPAEIVRSVGEGRFYSSTGVELASFTIEPRALEVTVKQNLDFKYTIYFIGDGGRVLAQSNGLHARYEPTAGLTYVRARIVDSGGRAAWTQPVFVRR